MSANADALAVAWRHHQAGNRAAAEELGRQVLDENPANGAALTLLGVVCLAQNRCAEAVEHLQRAVAVLPDDWVVYANLGVAIAGLGRPADAEASFRRALQLEPNHADTHFNLALASEQQERFGEAVAALREALRLNPQHALGWNRLGALVLRLGDANEAVSACAYALMLQPDFVPAHDNRGAALFRLGRWDESAAHFREVVRLQPKSAAALNNLGQALTEQGQLDEAVACLQRALDLAPRRVEIPHNLGVALMRLNRLNDADTCFARAIQLQPEHAEAHFYRGIVALTQGAYERGWHEYAWRWKCKEFQPRSFPQPRWDGSALSGRTILLYAEQGLGDTLQFIRYARLLKDRGATVLFECPGPLLRLLGNNRDIDRLVATGDVHPEFDVHAALLDLPGILGTSLKNIPATTPYLTADPSLVAAWTQELANLPGRKVGIIWRGKPRRHYDPLRSVALRQFEPLARVPGVHLVSMQKGAGAGEVAALADVFPVLDIDARLDEQHGPFMDTAAIMKCVDLVISVDTAAAHVAGALSVPVWILLPYAADWRWLRDRDDSPWYPSARLFRQTRPGDWSELFERVCGALTQVRGSR